MEFRADQDVVQTLTALGEAMPAGPALRLVLAGASAGLLARLLAPGRVTLDCDVIRVEPDGVWPELEAAAARVSRQIGAPPGWLSDASRRFAWSLPLGWEERCEPVGRFERIEVLRLSRLDLICSKILSAPRRPQDVRDLAAMAPTKAELAFAEENLDRLAAESLDRETFDHERQVIERLRRRR